MSGRRARKQKIDRRDRHDRVAVETVEVEHEQGSGLATSRSFKGAAVGVQPNPKARRRKCVALTRPLSGTLPPQVRNSP